MPEKDYALSNRAERDLATILRESGRRFGSMQQETYARLILRAFDLAAREPAGPGSRTHGDIAPGLRSLRVDRAGPRHGAAAHVIFYKQADVKGRGRGVLIVRILHEHMDPARHALGQN